MKNTTLLLEIAKTAAFGFSSLALASAAYIKGKGVLAAVKAGRAVAGK